RHTSFDCHWSSDVCSSDLSLKQTRPWDHHAGRGGDRAAEREADEVLPGPGLLQVPGHELRDHGAPPAVCARKSTPKATANQAAQIGRASCRVGLWLGGRLV